MLTLFSFSLAKSSILIVPCKSFVIVTDTSSSEESVKIKLILALSECYLYLLRAQKFDFQNESLLSVYPVKTWLDLSSGNGALCLPFLFSLHSRWTLLPCEPPLVAGPSGRGVIWACPEPTSLHTTKGFLLVVYWLPSSHLPLPAGTLTPVSQLPHPHSAEAPTSLPSGHPGSRE